MKNKKKKYAICSCCKKGRHKTEMKLMTKVFVSEAFGYLNSNQFIWACDVCLDSERAMFSNRAKMKPSYILPLVYFDTEHQCENCKKHFLFYKIEKKFWYEVLKFSTGSKPINCVDCRKIVRNKKNENTRLSDILINGEENLTIEELEELISIYDKWEMVERRKYFESKLKKKRNEKQNNKRS